MRTDLAFVGISIVGEEIPGIGPAAIHELTDELVHWLHRYEENLK
jgi:hypothetical protein